MIKLLFIVVMVLAYGITMPAMASTMQNEIDHLLSYVENSRCQYVRNGTAYSGDKAARHIRKKYDYFKGDIDSAEKFVELSATKSTMSGKFYTIQCDGRDRITSQVWLLQELRSFRSVERSGSGE